MKKLFLSILFFIPFLSGTVAANPWTPAQIAIYDPIQVFPETWDVYGARFNLIHGNNRRVIGLDMGLSNEAYTSGGLQLALFRNNAINLYGLQFSLILNNAETGIGSQIALINYNRTDVYNFVSLGLFNFGGATTFQFGVLNTASVYGIQLGLWNVGSRGDTGPSYRVHYYDTGRTVTRSDFIDADVIGFQIALAMNQGGHLKGGQLALMNSAGSMTGIQIGATDMVMGEVKGVQLGLLAAGMGYDGKDSYGIQISPINYAMRTTGVQFGLAGISNTYFNGVQVGFLFNNSDTVNGAQVGLINVADRVRGMQIGLINYCRRMSGIQIGMANIIVEGPVPFLPLFNISMNY